MATMVERTIKAFDSLTDAEKRQVLEILKGREKRGNLDESLAKDASLFLGPLDKPCPFCGK